ncbi:MAG: right-handed parallel beta-helix repeat-containing protein [Candidatus Aenigmarchaeota archaeon]|nr:right-handed parallel beta-helix repeat-containing protein [Candidatus Aenigmarchaeota archaeon]
MKKFIYLFIIQILILSLNVYSANIYVSSSTFCPSNTSSDIYYINTNVVFNCTTPININTTSYAIIINSNNIKLDCNNTLIFGNKTLISTTYGIYVSNKNNITIENCIISGYTNGIYFNSVSNSSIKNSTLFENSREGGFMEAAIIINGGRNNSIFDSLIFNNSVSGIYLESTNNNTIYNTTLFENRYFGLFIRYSSYTNISNNIFSKNEWAGVYLEGSHNNSIENNILSENTYNGITFHVNNNYNLIKNNIFINNTRRALHFYYYPKHSQIINNTFFGSGLFIDPQYETIYEPTNFTILNNTVNGLPIVYLKNINNLIFNEDAGQIILENVTNITISNYNFYDNSVGITLLNAYNITLINNTFQNSGVFLQLSKNNTFLNNYVNGKPLVYLENKDNYVVEDAGQVIVIDSTNISIKNLNLSNTVSGIFLINVSNSLIYNNFIANNSFSGIYVTSSSSNEFIEIENNTIENCSWPGILSFKDYLKISNNKIKNNYPDGICIINMYSLIFDNEVVGNQDDGISLLYFKNFVYNNYVENNRWGIASQPYEYGYNYIFKNILMNNTQIGIFLKNNKDTIVNDNLLKDNIIGIYGCCGYGLINITIINNTIINSYHAMKFDPLPAGNTNIQILNNKLINGSYYGIYVRNMTGQIENNSISNFKINFYVRDIISNLSIKNNTILNGFDYGVYLLNTNNTNFQNNILYFNNRSIYLTSSNNNSFENNTICYNKYGIYNNTPNIIKNNIFCADFISFPQTWTINPISNISINVSNILFQPASCYFKINNNLLGINETVYDFQLINFNFSEISSEGVYNINVYCNDSTGTNYANNSKYFVIGDVSILDLIFEQETIYTTTNINAKLLLNSSGPANLNITIYLNGTYFYSNLTNIDLGINEIPINIGKLNSGSYEIKVQIDPDNNLSELNESNNEIIKNIIVKLAQSGPTILESPKEFSSIQIIPAQKLISFDFLNYSIFEIDLIFSKDVSNISLSLNKTSICSQIEEVQRKNYDCYEIKKVNFLDSDILNVFLRFKVSKKWIKENNIEKYSIKLYRYNDGVWNAIQTKLVEEDEEYIYFVSETKYLSIYSISGQVKTITAPSEEKPTAPTEEKPTEKSTEKPADYTMILLGIIIILLIINILIKKFFKYRIKSKNKKMIKMKSQKLKIRRRLK